MQKAKEEGEAAAATKTSKQPSGGHTYI